MKIEDKTPNIEHRTPNIEVNNLNPNCQENLIAGAGVFLLAGVMKTPRYDLEERLLEYAAGIIRLVESMPKTRAANHVAGQLLRSGTSPLANHGEAESAESSADFVHKLRICLKELRETFRWLKLVQRVPLADPLHLDPMLKETDELIRIFVASIKTAQARRS